MTRSEYDTMLAGDPYRPDHPDLVAARAANQVRLARYNAAAATPDAERHPLLATIVASVGPGSVARPSLQCCYGRNTHLGRDVFLNFNCVILDVCAVTIGDGTQIGPAVQLLAADHPRDPDARRRGIEYGRPVAIGRNVWIGGGAIILPGVRVGDDAIVGAGAVVTRDVAPGATVVGNPARPLSPAGHSP